MSFHFELMISVIFLPAKFTVLFMIKNTVDFRSFLCYIKLPAPGSGRAEGALLGWLVMVLS